jgi:hypothetical protein
MANVDAARKYAPLWAVLMGAAAAVAKKTSTRYLMERSWTLKSSDIVVGLAVSVLSYVMYRMRYGHKNVESWYKR